MSKEKISVILVDDHPVVMEGLRTLVEKNENFEIAGSFTTGTDTLDFIRQYRADIVLLDISLPDINGIELCLQIKEINPEIRVLAISNHSERSLVTNMLQNGASGYLLKNASADELIGAIQSVIEGKIAFSEEVKKILARGEITTKKLPKLTRREKEIVKLVAEGLTTAQIAEKLFISPLTVETHRRNLMQKLDVNNSAALIKTAMEHDMI